MVPLDRVVVLQSPQHVLGARGAGEGHEPVLPAGAVAAGAHRQDRRLRPDERLDRDERLDCLVEVRVEGTSGAGHDQIRGFEGILDVGREVDLGVGADEAGELGLDGDGIACGDGERSQPPIDDHVDDEVEARETRRVDHLGVDGVAVEDARSGESS